MAFLLVSTVILVGQQGKEKRKVRKLLRPSHHDAKGHFHRVTLSFEKLQSPQLRKTAEGTVRKINKLHSSKRRQQLPQRRPMLLGPAHFPRSSKSAQAVGATVLVHKWCAIPFMGSCCNAEQPASK